MGWDVEFTDEFEEWWHTLSGAEQGKVDARVTLLMESGPSLAFPFSSQVKSSRYPEMRELRAQAGGDPLRYCTHLTLGAPRFYSWAVTRKAMIAGTKPMCR